MTASCMTCRYRNLEFMEGDESVVLECRRYPPTIVVLPDEVMRTFTNVDADDWCGEYSAEVDT